MSASVGCAGSAFTNGASGGAEAQGGIISANGGANAQGGITSASGGIVAEGGAVSAGGSGSGGVLASSGGMAAASPISKDRLLLWLSADRDVTTTSGAVSKWQDESNSHNDATQVLAIARPRVVSGGGSLPMIEFDGDDDALALPEGFDDFQSGVSFFAIVEPEDDSNCSSIVQLSAGPEIEDIDFGRQSQSVHYENGDIYVTGTPEALPKGERKLVGVVHSTSGEVELRIDGQYIKSTSMVLPATLPRSANFIARSLYSNCSALKARIGEIVLYARAVPSAERVQIEAYLRNKWACCGN